MSGHSHVVGTSPQRRSLGWLECRIMKNPQAGQQEVDSLRSGCEQCIACLKELFVIHFEMDPADRLIRPDDEEFVYRLRKVLLHAKAVTGWQFDTDVMHVLAPEFRAADEQIDRIWKKIPDDQLSEYLARKENCMARMKDRFSKTERKILSSYIHPTPQRLLLAKEQGGLGEVDEVRYYYILFVLLGNLVFRYAVSLVFLSQIMNSRREGPIASVLRKMVEAFDSMSPKDCLRVGS